VLRHSCQHLLPALPVYTVIRDVSVRDDESVKESKHRSETEMRTQERNLVKKGILQKCSLLDPRFTEPFCDLIPPWKITEADLLQYPLATVLPEGNLIINLPYRNVLKWNAHHDCTSLR
jgi:hypothetical protein